MVKHTSGPWFCDTYEGVVGDVSDANGNSVAQAQARQPLAAGKPDEERLANARLIAAAPDLLEALKVCATLINIQNGNLHQDVNAILDMAKAAVDKAEGKS